MPRSLVVGGNAYSENDFSVLLEIATVLVECSESLLVIRALVENLGPLLAATMVVVGDCVVRHNDAPFRS